MITTGQRPAVADERDRAAWRPGFSTGLRRCPRLRLAQRWRGLWERAWVIFDTAALRCTAAAPKSQPRLQPGDPERRQTQRVNPQ